MTAKVRVLPCNTTRNKIELENDSPETEKETYPSEEKRESYEGKMTGIKDPQQGSVEQMRPWDTGWKKGVAA